jgi:hypothetical protein
MTYKLKYIAWKQKYLNLKNLSNIQSGAGDTNPYIVSFYPPKNDNKTNSESDDDNESDNKNKTPCSDEPKINPEIQKTEPGRGLLGDAMYYWIANTKINKPKDFVATWTYKEPEIETIQPEIVPYTEFNQEILQLLYSHIRSEYDEGFDIGYIVGYECGCNQNNTPEKKIPPGNISDPDFLNGFYDGFDLAFYKGTKYYYTTWLQINNNNVFYKRNLISNLSNPPEDKNIYVDKTDPNYDVIQERQFNEYYVYLKKKIIGKTHWFI